MKHMQFRVLYPFLDDVPIFYPLIQIHYIVVHDVLNLLKIDKKAP